MIYMLNHPRILCALCFVVFYCMARLGAGLRIWFKVPDEETRENLTLVVSAALTLLGLIIGFTFSMATTRYDQRRLYEEQEANAIGTEYVRADLLPPEEATEVKNLLVQYLDWRLDFYRSGYGSEVDRADAGTVALQGKLWRSVQAQAKAQPNPVTALVVSGMNDVLNSQGYTQFSWWNRIPVSAWELMVIIALFANGLIGYASRRAKDVNLLLFVLPLLVSVSFFLVADIDTPRGGTIRIPPRDLTSLSISLHEAH